MTPRPSGKRAGGLAEEPRTHSVAAAKPPHFNVRPSPSIDAAKTRTARSTPGPRAQRVARTGGWNIPRPRLRAMRCGRGPASLRLSVPTHVQSLEVFPLHELPPKGATTSQGNRCREETSTSRTIVPLSTVLLFTPADGHAHLDNRSRTVYEGQVMDLNKFTEKAQAAVMEAQNLATRDQHQAVDVEHVVLALLEQEGGLVSRLFEKAKASPDLLKARLSEELARLPRVSGDTTAAPGLYVTQS